MGGGASGLLCSMLAMSVNLWKRLYFYKVSVWSSFAWGLSVDFASREEIAEQEGSRPGAINAIASVDAGEYRRLYSNVMKAERETVEL